MVNQRLLDLANRMKNKELPSLFDEKILQTQRMKKKKVTNTSFPDKVNESFILSYDGNHKDFCQELIAKSNELFRGTEAEIPQGTSGEVQNMYILKRLGLITSIYNNSQLRSQNLLPITPSQSEYLLESAKLPNPGNNWEDLALILYDRSQDGENPQEAQALYDSLRSHRQDLSLSQSDLENKLIIVNAGLKKDSDSNHGVVPIVLPGITQVYTHEVLEKVGEDFQFNGYGISGGLPLVKQINDNGSRYLWLPDEEGDIGLRLLYRGGGLNLGAWNRSLTSSNADGRVNIAPQARAS